VAVSRVAGLLPGSPTGAQWAWTGMQGGGLACWAATRLCRRETKLVYSKLGAILNTVQGSLLPYTTRTHTDTHTHTQGCAMGPPMWPWRCGLMARPVSGVEWRGTRKLLGFFHLFQANQQTSLFVALALVTMVTSLLRRHWQQCGVESWSLTVMLRDFIATWTLQIDRPYDRYGCHSCHHYN